MDTNMAQALKMAGGVLIALVIIATLTYFFRELTPFQQQLEDIEALEQTADFNKEYEVFNKNLMLGVDLISVINKAYSNNKAYLENYGVENVEDLRDTYLIDIEILSDINLIQTLDIRRARWNGDRVTEDAINVSDLEEADSEDDIKKLIGLNSVDSLQDSWGPITLHADSLIDVSPAVRNNFYTNQEIYNIIISNTELKKTVKNTNPNTKEDWSRAVLETFAYNLKTKKFRCVGVENSTQTGRIIKMTFREI